MPYTNTVVTTSTSGSWNGTSISYSTIELIDGIPHSAQIEVERIFTVDRSGNPITDFLNNTATTEKDKREVFVIPVSRITFNETNKTITAIDLPSAGNTYDYDPEGVGVSNVPVPAINVGNTLKIRRKTVSNQALVTWSAGTKLTSNQLNLETTQLLHLVQELIDKVTTETTVSNTTIGSVPDSSITPAKLSGGGPVWNSNGDLTVSRNLTIDTNTLFVDGVNNRVGIGTETPSVKLQVHENSTGISTIQVTNTTTGTTSTDGLALAVSSTAASVWNYENTPLAFATNGVEKVRILADGSVGIGTTTPTTKLDVNGNIRLSAANAVIELNTGGSQIYSTAANTLQFATSGGIGSAVESMRISSNGRVGIGTTNPLAKLVISNNGAEGLEIVPDNTSNLVFIQTYNRSTSAFNTMDLRASDYKIRIGSTEKVTIDTSGNVGITGALSVTGVATFTAQPLYGSLQLAATEATVTAQAASATSGFRFGTNAKQYSPNAAWPVRYTKIGKLVKVSGLVEYGPTSTGTNATTLSSGTTILRGLPSADYLTMAIVRRTCPTTSGAAATENFGTCRVDITTSGDLNYADSTCYWGVAGTYISVDVTYIAQ